MMVQITQEELRRLRTARELLNPDDGRHGTRYGYTCGCRCDRCKAVNSRYNKPYRIAKWRREQEAKR